jgi:hypothetical protein
MDPFIEGCGLWEDFHTHFVEKIGEALADLVPENYLVRTGQCAYVHVEEEFREKFVGIHEVEGDRRLVTGIEVLSPSNKKRNSPGWDQYLRKRQGFFASRSANLYRDRPAARRRAHADGRCLA